MEKNEYVLGNECSFTTQGYIDNILVIVLANGHGDYKSHIDLIFNKLLFVNKSCFRRNEANFWLHKREVELLIVSYDFLIDGVNNGRNYINYF